MEETSSFPNWAKYTIVAIIIVTIVTVAYFIYKSNKNAADDKSLLQSEPLKDELKAEVKQDMNAILANAHIAFTS